MYLSIAEVKEIIHAKVSYLIFHFFVENLTLKFTFCTELRNYFL